MKCDQTCKVQLSVLCSFWLSTWPMYHEPLGDTSYKSTARTQWKWRDKMMRRICLNHRVLSLSGSFSQIGGGGRGWESGRGREEIGYNVTLWSSGMHAEESGGTHKTPIFTHTHTHKHTQTHTHIDRQRERERTRQGLIKVWFSFFWKSFNLTHSILTAKQFFLPFLKQIFRFIFQLQHDSM